MPDGTEDQHTATGGNPKTSRMATYVTNDQLDQSSVAGPRMSAPSPKGKRSGGRKAPKPGAPDATRGLVIVVVAALLGVLLLARGGTSTVLDTATSTPADSSATTTTVVGLPPIDKPTTTPAPPPTNAPASVNVAIFNGTGGKIVGAAGKNRDKLTPLGFAQVQIYDTAATEKSVVYYGDGARGDAAAIAKALGFDDAAIESVSSATDLPSTAEGADVVVIVGQDAPAT